MKAIKKTIKIEIDYYDKNDLELAINHVIDIAKLGKKTLENGKVANASYHWTITFDINNYREEQINGIWHMIIPSSIKKKDKA